MHSDSKYKQQMAFSTVLNLDLIGVIHSTLLEFSPCKLKMTCGSLFYPISDATCPI